MWELIRANKRKSIILMAIMGSLLIALGYAIGYAYAGEIGALIGLAAAVGIWIIQSLIAYFAGSKILLATSRASLIQKDMHPQLYNIVEEMKIAANLPYMPKIYIIPEQTPNAFASGTNPKNSTIAVTAGLLAKLNRDELQGVIAHEMSHILNRDILFMTYAATMLGTIVLISEVYVRTFFFTGSSSRRRYSKPSGSNIYMIIIPLLLAILSPIIAQLLYFAISRKREYLADACAVRLTRYPVGLASALEKISHGARSGGDLDDNKITRPLYISDPKQESSALSSLGSTHPPIHNRIAILQKLSGSVGFSSYQRAYSKINSKKCDFMPASALKEKDLKVRQASARPEKSVDQKTQARQVGDMIMAANSFAFIQCQCGMKIKLPPSYDKPQVRCPRCKTIHSVPTAEMAGILAGLNAAKGKNEPSQAARKPKIYTYKRRASGGWESFKCKCDNLIQLSPAFKGDHINCSSCGTRVNIKN